MQRAHRGFRPDRCAGRQNRDQHRRARRGVIREFRLFHNGESAGFAVRYPEARHACVLLRSSPIKFRLALGWHSPGGVVESGLPMRPPEKKATKLGFGVRRDIFSGPV